jgi:cupin 2 domain-containing protein
MKSGNIFESIPKILDIEAVDLLVQNEKVKIERIISKGHASPVSGWYDQEKDEWVIVLKGDAVISFESGKQVKLKTGDYLDIPAHVKHKVSWTDPDIETVWVAVHY